MEETFLDVLVLAFPFSVQMPVAASRPPSRNCTCDPYPEAPDENRQPESATNAS